MRYIIAALLAALPAACGKSDSSDDTPPPVVSSSGQQQNYSNGHPLSSPTGDASVLAKETEIFNLVNNHRVTIGLNALIDAGNVRDIARAHSQHMIVHSFFDHVNPEGDPVDGRFNRAGVGWSAVGENIAAGYGTAQAAFDAWMNSTPHRANIERDLWTHTGVGYARNGAPTPGFPYADVWTQNFLRP
jgi:uncharacterized protein YkwD